MENKIEINDVWYVREDIINDSLTHLEKEEVDVTFTEKCCYETDKYSFVASRIRRGGSSSGEFYPDITIKFTDKRSANIDTWKEEFWDNNN